MKERNLSLKRLVIPILIYIYFPSLVLAQQRERGTIEVNPFFGYSTSFINGSGIQGLSSRNATRFGIVGDLYFNNRWSIRSGISYVSMGATSLFGPELKLNYLNIPVNMNWHFGSTRKWNLNFGLTPGFLQKAEADGVNIKELYESFHLGVSYGIGYRIGLSKKLGILLDWQGLVGITYIPASLEPSWLNAMGSFNAGIVFAIE